MEFVCQFTWNNNTVQRISKYSAVLDHEVETLGLYIIQSFFSGEAKSMSLTKELLPSEGPRQENTISSHQVTQSEKADSRSEFVASKRQIVPSKTIDSEEFRIERAIDLKARRAGHLGDVTKKLNLVQDLLAGGAIEEEVLRSVDDYEHTSHRFVDAHEKYFRFEDDEGMEAVAKESYEKEIERKFLLDVDISEWNLT